MITEPAVPPASPAAGCGECRAPLAHDQRYCVECGARRGPLPASIAQLIGAIHEQGPAPALPPGTPLADSVIEPAVPRRMQFVMPGPRAASAAVIGMLGFGVIVGALAGGTSVATLASAPMIVLNLAPANHSTPTVVSVPASSAPGDTGGGGAASAGAPATTQASASPTTSPTSSGGGGTTTSPSAGFGGLPPVKHVFLIVLSDRGIAKSFGAGSSGGYLGGALRRQGELIENYFAVASAPLANEIALISGQGPTAQTASDCPVFSRISPAGKGPRGQILGSGCAYPATAKTLAGQLTSAGDAWKAYIGGVGGGASTACRVPKLGSRVPQMARSASTYLAWRNPFAYFRSLTSGGACRSHEVGLGQLASDLKSDTTTPSLAYIVPSPCQDGSEAPCTPHTRPALAGANRFLKTVVPEIKHSAAYQNGGLIAITFDQAPQTGADADPSACCGPASYPNLRRLAAPPAVPPAATGTGTATTPSTTSSTTSSTGTAPSATTTTDTAPSATTTTGTATTGTTTSTTSTTPSTSTTSTTPSTSTTPTPTTPTSLSGGGVASTGGGGHVGLLLISQYVKPNSTDVIDYFNHYSLLGSIEKLFGLRRLGYAGAPAISVFGLGVFNAYSG